MKKVTIAAMIIMAMIMVMSSCQSATTLEKVESNLTPEQIELFNNHYNLYNETVEDDPIIAAVNLATELYEMELYVEQGLLLPENGVELYKEWREAAHLAAEK